MIDASQQRIAHLEKRVGAQTKSPLFAQLANLYLEAQRAQDALRVCDAGLANFPFYTTGHLIKGKTLLALNMRAEARREFEFVLDFLPNNEAVINLLSQIPPSEEESIGSVSPTVTEELVTPEQPPPVYEAPSPLAPEPSYGFKTTETPAPEISPVAGVTAGTTFFDAVIQAPPVSTSEDIFGLGIDKPSVEAPVTPEPSTFDGFNFPQQETPTFPEPSPTSIEPTGGFDLSTSTVEPSINCACSIRRRTVRSVCTTKKR